MVAETSSCEIVSGKLGSHLIKLNSLSSQEPSANEVSDRCRMSPHFLPACCFDLGFYELETRCLPFMGWVANRRSQGLQGEHFGFLDANDGYVCSKGLGELDQERVIFLVSEEFAAVFGLHQETLEIFSFHLFLHVCCSKIAVPNQELLTLFCEQVRMLLRKDPTMDDMLSFDYNRRFGVEIEVNSFDGRDFKDYPLGKNEHPLGMDYIAVNLAELLQAEVNVAKWEYTHHNNCWVLKPDSSCGIELCSPVVKRWTGLKTICRAVDILDADERVIIDDRCSLHVHVEVADLDHRRLAAVLAFWIKCEAVFLDSVPSDRKKSKFCPCIGEVDMFSHDDGLDADRLIHKMGASKYYTANVYHMMKGRRSTIEFRIVGAEGCRNSFLTKNWIRLLLHFIERSSNYPLHRFRPGNPWTSLCWLDPTDVMSLLGFDGSFRLSPGLEQTRNWFLSRLHTNIRSNLSGVWSPDARSVAIKQVDQLIAKFDIDPADYLTSEDGSATYAETFKA